MGSSAADAAALRAEIDESLDLEISAACESALALARLETALPHVIDAVGHLALCLDTRETAAGRTHSLRFLGTVVMHWCFTDRCVDVYYWSRGRTCDPDHLRLTYDGHSGDWRVSMPGKLPLLEGFRDEEEKVLEVIRDAIHGLSPWSQPDGEPWA